MYAFLDAAPGKNGTSDPFVVHPGPFARVQLVRAISGQTGVDDAIGAMAQKAKELKAQFK